MERTIRFGAPWGRSLKLITGLVAVILLSVPVIEVLAAPPGQPAVFMMALVPLLVLVISVFFVIRGYVLTPEALLIERLGWKSRVSLSGLQSVQADPEATKGSLRTCGNGGLFCFAGAFWNKRLGTYRAFATDLHRAVVLRFAKKVIVVTPDDPEAFVAGVKAMTNPP